VQPLLDDQLFLIAPIEARADSRSARQKPITLEQLADHPLIIPSRPHAMRMAVENALAGIDRKIRVAYEIECIPAVIDLVRQGHGFGVLPMNAVNTSRWAHEVTPKSIGDPALKISLSIVTSAQRPKGPLMRKAIDMIREVVGKEIRANSAANGSARRRSELLKAIT